MVQVSHRLKGALEGAFAGGGDPASSPLYVFGPFLQLVVASGAGAVCFGTPIWLVVLTVAVVSLMYRHVMHWISDGSGGSGLCGEEFGGWAVKLNASITAIEYTLTFLVSLAALVTFVADRAGGLGRWERSLLAVALTLAVGVAVNRGPRRAARVFGPATAAVLALLWVLVFAVLVRQGFRLPVFSPRAFSRANLHTTLGGYVRLLALMTGIEVFANLVAAYNGPPGVRARKAFGSLIIVMTTTLVTMVIVGPAIFELADPMREDVSVFTQTMDQLLPAPMAYFGTMVGIVVLLSAAAASAQGIQNLSLGMRHRNYIPASFGQRNRFDVADRPVYAQVILVAACFAAFGTSEKTYLALYAAGVFVLLGLTGWAAVKRLLRERKTGGASDLSLLGTVLAALFTSGAAGLIFFERFMDGAWAYVVLVPILYVVFTRYRGKLGAPTLIEERLGRVLSEQKSFLPIRAPSWPQGVLAIIDGSQASEAALIAGAHVAKAFAVPWAICVVGAPALANRLALYLRSIEAVFRPVKNVAIEASAATAMTLARGKGLNLLVIAKEISDARSLARTADLPLLVVHGSGDPAPRYPALVRILVGLDGSSEAEAALPYAARFLATGAEVVLLAVPDGDTTPETLEGYVARVREGLRGYGAVEVLVDGSGPARTIVEKAREGAFDLVVVASHGRGGASRAPSIPLGSVPERLFSDLECALLIVPARSARGIPNQGHF